MGWACMGGWMGEWVSWVGVEAKVWWVRKTQTRHCRSHGKQRGILQVPYGVVTIVSGTRDQSPWPPWSPDMVKHTTQIDKTIITLYNPWTREINPQLPSSDRVYAVWSLVKHSQSGESSIYLERCALCAFVMQLKFLKCICREPRVFGYGLCLKWCYPPTKYQILYYYTSVIIK